MNEIKNNQIEPENELLIEKLSNLYKASKEKNDINRMLIAKINETPFKSIKEKKSIFIMPPRIGIRFAAAAAVAVMAFTSIFYLADFNNSNNTQSFVGYTKDSSKKMQNVDSNIESERHFIEDGNILVYQF